MTVTKINKEEYLRLKSSMLKNSMTKNWSFGYSIFENPKKFKIYKEQQNRFNFWHWFGGYFDGEGSINISYSQEQNKFLVRASIKTTDKRIIKFIQDRLHIGSFNLKGIPGGVIINKKTKLPYNSKLQYSWTLSSKENLRMFVDNIKDYLVEKRKQCLLLNTFLGLYNRSRTLEQNKKCIEIALRISYLNKI